MIKDERIVEFEKFLDKLFSEITDINSIFIFHKHLMNRRKDRLEELELAPSFFSYVIETFFSETIIKLSKFYENYNGKQRRSERNLNKFLNFIEQNIDIFSECKIDRNIIEKHRKSISNSEAILDNIFTWRDKYYAHNDKKYFFNPEQLGIDFNIKVGEIDNLIELAGDILNYYSRHYFEKGYFIDATNQKDIDKVLDILHEYNQEENK